MRHWQQSDPVVQSSIFWLGFLYRCIRRCRSRCFSVFGAGNREGVRKAVHTTLAIAVAAGAILTVAGVVTTPMILRAMDTPQEVFEQSSQYLQVYFGGIFFSAIYNMSAGILNAVGNSRRSLIYLIIAAFSNIFLDIFFVVILKGNYWSGSCNRYQPAFTCIFILGFLMRMPGKLSCKTT